MPATAVMRKHQPERLPPVSVETRDNLLLMATGRFCAKARYDRISMDQYKEAFYLLIEDVSNATKQKVAQCVSNCKGTPRQIALYLALEPLEISVPILSQSTTLGQLDLLRIVEMKSNDYAAVIAARPDVGPNLAKRLKQFNDLKVQEALNQNYALNDQVREERSLTYISEARSTLKGSTSTTVSQSTNASSTGKTSAESALLAAAARGGRIENPDTSEKALPSTTHFGEKFERAARAGNSQAMITLVQREAGLSAHTIQQVFQDHSGDSMSVLLSALEVSPQQTNRIMMLVYPSIGLSVQNAERSIQFFAQLNSASSKAAVEQWPKIARPNAQHEGHLQDTDNHRINRQIRVHKDTTHVFEQNRQTG